MPKSLSSIEDVLYQEPPLAPESALPKSRQQATKFSESGNSNQLQTSSPSLKHTRHELTVHTHDTICTMRAQVC